MGTANWNYAADAWRLRGAQVAAFRTPPPPPAPLTASISGPVFLDTKTSATYTANVSGGTGTSTSYAWYRRSPGSAYYYTGCATQTCLQQSALDDFELKLEVSRGGQTAVATKYVTVGDEPPFLRAEPLDELPTEVAISQANPNPVRGSATLTLALPEDARVRRPSTTLSGAKSPA
jgi:hypothetical protein